VAVFYPASQALLPRLAPAELLPQASALSRLAMNSGQMGGAAIAGLVVAAIGPGWALEICGIGMLCTLPVLLSLRAGPGNATARRSVLHELHVGWSEFRSRTWLWVIVAQYSVVVMAWFGGFQVLGPVVARAHLGGPAAWGAITAAESVGFIVGGIVSLRFTPRRPILFVASIGATMAIPTLALAMLWPLVLVCVASFAVGVGTEVMMVQWTVAMAVNIPPDRLARVSSYDGFGSYLATPAGALAAGPIAAAVGVSVTQYGAVVLALTASLLALIPRDVRSMVSAGHGIEPAHRADAEHGPRHGDRGLPAVAGNGSAESASRAAQGV
jgi:predicted MFS family arabinose efflux permease